MAVSQQRNQLVALLSEGVPGPDSIAFVDIPTLRVRATRSVPVRDVRYRGLELGRQSGRIYLFGNRIVGPDGGPEHGPPSDAVVTVLDPSGTEVIFNWTVRPSLGRNWTVLRGALASDERQIFLSYHGPDTQGMDVLSVGPSGFQQCVSVSDPSSGCIRLHGDFEFYRGGYLAATGGPEIQQLSSSGKVQRALNTLLENNHLMEFAIDLSNSKLYAVGSCSYVPGLSAVSLTSGQTQMLDRLGGTVCGERVVLGPVPVLIVLQFQLQAPDSQGALLVIDGRNGKVLRRVTTPTAPIDLIYVPN
jgi:hypothetical protein